MNKEQAIENLKDIVDFYKLNDENNYDYSDEDLISMRIVLEEIDRLNNIINETKRILGQYKHYLTPTEEQNAKNETIVDIAYEQLGGNNLKELKEE